MDIDRKGLLAIGMLLSIAFFSLNHTASAGYACGVIVGVLIGKW